MGPPPPRSFLLSSCGKTVGGWCEGGGGTLSPLLSPGDALVDASSHHMSDRSCQSTGQRDPGEADTGGAGGGGVFFFFLLGGVWRDQTVDLRDDRCRWKKGGEKRQ